MDALTFEGGQRHARRAAVSPFTFFAAFGVAFVIVGAALIALNLLTARAIGRRQGYVLCMISAALCCLGSPYGTLLGIATFIVLGRPHVKAMFEGSPPSLSASWPRSLGEALRILIGSNHGNRSTSQRKTSRDSPRGQGPRSGKRACIWFGGPGRGVGG
ncbi:MAG: hypothetical protein ACXWFQ_08770 [Thermoanaerobaculia bacterium]